LRGMQQYNKKWITHTKSGLGPQLLLFAKVNLL